MRLKRVYNCFALLRDNRIVKIKYKHLFGHDYTCYYKTYSGEIIRCKQIIWTGKKRQCKYVLDMMKEER